MCQTPVFLDRFKPMLEAVVEIEGHVDFVSRYRHGAESKAKGETRKREWHLCQTPVFLDCFKPTLEALVEIEGLRFAVDTSIIKW